MEEIKKYIVHSNIDDKNIYKEFDNAEDAIKYAKDNIANETSVEAVICEESCEKFTIWSYEDGNYLDQDFPESDIADIKDVDDPEYAELEKEYDKLDKLDFSEAIKQLEENEDCVECTMCLENTPKEHCVKTPMGYVCEKCAEGLKESVDKELVEDKDDKIEDDPFEDIKEVEPEEKELEIPEDFEGQIDFLAADEDEAIKGYDAVIKVIEDEHIKGELEKIKTEEVAHKEFLEKIKADPTVVYTGPLIEEEPKDKEEPKENVEDNVELEEGKDCKKDLKEDLESEIKDYLAYCEKEKIEPSDVASLTKYINSGEYKKDLKECDKKEIKEEINPNRDIKIGDIIHINHLQGEDNSYDGKEGMIKAIDDLGQLHGTWGGVAVIPEADDFDIIEAEVQMQEASSAEKKAFKQGGDAMGDLVQGKAIARIKDPKDKEAAIAAAKAGRPDVVKQFTGDRKEDQAYAAVDSKMQKMADAGVKECKELHEENEEEKKPIENTDSVILDAIKNW